LTYALVVEGLKEGAADNEPRDGAVFIREWFDYATARVPQIQMEKLREARELGEDFSFIEGEGRTVDPEKSDVGLCTFIHKGLHNSRVFFSFLLNICARPKLRR
jgi:hypothetical protein